MRSADPEREDKTSERAGTPCADHQPSIGERVTQYARDVLDGKLVAGKWVRRACRRHLRDLERADTPEYKYFFDTEEAGWIIDFAETLILSEGEEFKQLELYPFQAFILGSLNGWRKKSNGARRFRTSYIQLGRQNGKSLFNAILAAYYGNFSGYWYPQIYCTATQKEQAKIVWREVKRFINADPDLAEWYKVHDHNSTIDCLKSGGFIRALSGDTERADGFRPYLGIVDEYHAHRTNQMYKLLEGGMKQMKSALLSVITTAGFDLKSPCRELYETCRNILDDVFENETQFVYIAEMDEGDDIWDPRNWIKANPMLEYTPDAIENLEAIAVTARAVGGMTLRDFMVKQLNMWLQFTENMYIKDIDVLKACGRPGKTLAAFRGMRAYAGLDLSSGGDLTSVALVFPFIVDGTKKYYIWSHSFIPARRLQEHIQTDSAPYDMWLRDGLLTPTETLGGIKTDYKYIIRKLKNICDEFEIEIALVCYDPHNASAFLSDLEALGVDSLSVTQSARNLNDATVDLRLEIEAGNVEYDGDNGMLVWSFANMRTTSNSFGEIKPDKDLKVERIDPVAAVIDAWTAAMRDECGDSTDKLVNDWLEMIDSMKRG